MADELHDTSSVAAALASVADLQRRIDEQRVHVTRAHAQLLSMLPPPMRDKASVLGVVDLVAVVHKKRKAWQASSPRIVELEQRVAALEASREQAKQKLTELLEQLAPGQLPREADVHEVLHVLERR